MLLLLRGSWSVSRAVSLQLCSCAPSCASWLRVARASVELDDWSAAESALIQANALDKSNASVWVRLAVACLKSQQPQTQPPQQSARLTLSHQSLLQAVALGCDDSDEIAHVGCLYADAGQLDLAAATLSRALAIRDSAPTRAQLAAVRQAQKRFEQAETELESAERLAQHDDNLTQAAIRTQREALAREIAR